MSGQRRSASASNVPSPAHSIPQRLLISQQPYSASASPPNNQSPSAISRTMAMAFLVFPQRSAFSRLVPQRGGTISLIQHYFKQRVPSSIPHSSAVSSIQHPASSIQHPASSIQHPASSIQHPASSIQHPASSIQHPASTAAFSNSTSRLSADPEQQSIGEAMEACAGDIDFLSIVLSMA